MPRVEEHEEATRMKKKETPPKATRIKRASKSGGPSVIKSKEIGVFKVSRHQRRKEEERSSCNLIASNCVILYVIIGFPFASLK